MVSEKRKAELYSIWLNEDMTDDSDEDWRDSLNGEERSLVNIWDKKYHSGIYHLCLDILQAER